MANRQTGVTRESIIKLMEDFIKEYNKKTTPHEYSWRSFESFLRGLADDIKQARIEEHIKAQSKRGMCNSILIAGENEDDHDFYDGYDDTKTGCGSYGCGMPCVCGKKKRHKGNHECGECGEGWQ